MSTPANGFSTQALPRTRTIVLILYNIVLTIVLSAMLYRVVVDAADAEARRMESGVENQPATPAPLPVPAVQPVGLAPDSAVLATPVAAPDLNATSSETEMDGDFPADDTVVETAALPAAPPASSEAPVGDPRMIAFVLFAITLAGALGGALSNLRGVFEFTRENAGEFPAYLELPFYLRPVSGMLCGLFTFFVSTFFAGALSSAGGAGWRTLDGMFPYVGIAFIAGFAAQEFMERLRDTARTLFGNGTAAVPVVTTPAEPVVPASGLESLPGQADDGFESLGKREVRAPQTPPAPPPPTVTVPQKRAD